VFSYIPMLGVQIAFKDYNPVAGIWGSPWVGWKHFDNFMGSPFFWEIIKNTLRISVYTLIVGTIAAILLALALNEVKSRGFKRSVQMATYAPYFISVVVLIGMVDVILSPTAGLYGQIARLFGVDNPPDLMGSPAAFPSVYVWSGVWQETGYGAVLYLAALAGVNPELYEAARMDGASRIRKIFHIDLPAIQSTIVVLFILSIGGLLGVGFEKVYLLQNLLNMSTSEVISTYVYKVGLVNSNFSFSVAVNLFNSVIGFILILGANLMARRMTNSSLF